MKINRVVTMVGATTTTGKLASDMYDLNNKTYYSESKGQEIPISEMDFQYMVRAFVKLCDQENMLDRSKHMGTTKDLVAKIETRDYTLEELRKEKDEALDEGVSLANQVENLKELIKEKDEKIDSLKKLSMERDVTATHYREAYKDAMTTNGSRYVFSEIPNNEYGKKLTRGMKVFLNDESYSIRVRGQHVKPELKGTGVTSYGQSIEQSTHLRVYIDKKKGA